jgi:hypothetical protein
VDLAVIQALANAQKRRYLFRPNKYRKGRSEERFTTDLDSVGPPNDSGNDTDSGEVDPWLNDDEFIQKYRMRVGEALSSCWIRSKTIQCFILERRRNKLQSHIK